MGKVIRLTESDLHNIINKSVRRILNEMDLVDAGGAWGTAERKAKDYDWLDKIHSWFGGKTKEQYQAQAARIKQNADYLKKRMKDKYVARGWNGDDIEKDADNIFKDARYNTLHGIRYKLPKFKTETQKEKEKRLKRRRKTTYDDDFVC